MQKIIEHENCCKMFLHVQRLSYFSKWTFVLNIFGHIFASSIKIEAHLVWLHSTQKNTNKSYEKKLGCVVTFCSAKSLTDVAETLRG